MGISEEMKETPVNLVTPIHSYSDSPIPADYRKTLFLLTSVIISYRGRPRPLETASTFGYLTNRPQVSMVYRMIKHAGCSSQVIIQKTREFSNSFLTQ